MKSSYHNRQVYDSSFRDICTDNMKYDTTILRITKRITDHSRANEVPHTEEDLEEEDDEKLNILKTATDGPLVVYDIIHSPSFEVPVLYLTLKNLPSGRPPSIDKLYQILVPDGHKASMQAVGQMGALSLTEHPVTGTSVYFVHPCRTREAMEPVLNGRRVNAEEYVVLWLGTIGASVGLDVPVSLATSLITAQRDG